MNQSTQLGASSWPSAGSGDGGGGSGGQQHLEAPTHPHLPFCGGGGSAATMLAACGMSGQSPPHPRPPCCGGDGRAAQLRAAAAGSTCGLQLLHPPWGSHQAPQPGTCAQVLQHCTSVLVDTTVVLYEPARTRVHGKAMATTR